MGKVKNERQREKQAEEESEWCSDITARQHRDQTKTNHAEQTQDVVSPSVASPHPPWQILSGGEARWSNSREAMDVGVSWLECLTSRAQGRCTTRILVQTGG